MSSVESIELLKQERGEKDSDVTPTPQVEAEDMAAASKEVNPEKPSEDNANKPSTTPPTATPSASTDDGIFSIIYSIGKKILVVGTIYLVGYMGWSIAWLITPMLLSVAREQWAKKSEARRNIAKLSATCNERDVILARIDELPAWVYFPDVERCEWVNRILKQIWPNANHYARDLVKETIEPSVAKSLSKYKLNGFQFDRIILGTIPPRIGGVKIYDKNVSRNEIVMDLDFLYAGDCDINFAVSGLKGGLKDFQISGTVRVVMKPLINSMPLVGGLQIFFLNNPNVDFNLVGVVDLLDVPGISDILRKSIIEIVANMMVLPNKLTITLSDEVPTQSLRMPEPEGVLRIHVVEAKDLMRKDVSMLGKGKSDPYAIITIGAQEYKTQVIDNTVNPKWDYWCETAILAESGQVFEIDLFDKDETSDDERLGRATVEISNVIKRGVLDAWLTLEQAKHGMVHVRLTWLKLSSNANDLQQALQETRQLGVSTMSTALLTVYIDSAKNLPQARTQSNPDPYVLLSLGKRSYQTTVQMRTDSPVFEQGFTFLVHNPVNDTIQITVIDYKTGNEIGNLKYIINHLLSKQNLEIIAQPFQLKKSGPESKLLLSFSLRILKHSPTEDDDTTSIGSSQFEDGGSLSRASSIKTASNIEQSPIKKEESLLQSSAPLAPLAQSIEQPFIAKSIESIAAVPSGLVQLQQDVKASLVHRVPDKTSSSGEHGLGRVQITLRYTVQRQKLTVLIHKIMNIPLKDPSNIPDPYVKLYILPGRSKETKRKTNVIKDDCNPVYDATFEYIISSDELLKSELEVTVCTQKGFLSGGSPVIGMLRIPFNNPAIDDQGFTSWYDLLPEMKHDQ